MFRLHTRSEVERAGRRIDHRCDHYPWGEIVEGRYVEPWRLFVRIKFKHRGRIVEDSVSADVVEPIRN